MSGYSTFAVLGTLCIVISGVYPFSMPFLKTLFHVESPDKVKEEDTITNHMNSMIPFSTNATLSLKSLFESFIGQKELVLNTIVPAVLCGLDLAIFRSTVQSIYDMGGITRGYNIVVLAFTSMYPVVTIAANNEKFSNITTQSKTYFEKFWGIFHTEEIIITPPPEDSNLFNILKRNFSWTVMKDSTFNVKKIVQTLSETVGYKCSSIMIASLYVFVTVLVINFIYESFKGETIKKLFTDEEILEEYKDNEDLYPCLEELLTPERQRGYGEWNYDLSEDSDDSYYQHSMGYSQY